MNQCENPGAPITPKHPSRCAYVTIVLFLFSSQPPRLNNSLLWCRYSFLHRGFPYLDAIQTFREDSRAYPFSSSPSGFISLSSLCSLRSTRINVISFALQVCVYANTNNSCVQSYGKASRPAVCFINNQTGRQKTKSHADGGC